MTTRTKPVEVAILAFDGCLSSAVVGICDALEVANTWAARRNDTAHAAFASRVLTPSGQVVRGSAGFAIPAGRMSSAARADVIIVPPMLPPIAQMLEQNVAIVRWLEKPSPAVIASVCTGAFFLAEAGLLGGRRATSHPLFAREFQRRYPDVELTPEARIVDTGRILTVGSTTSFLDLAIHLIDRFAGHELAVLTAKTLSVDLSYRSQLPFFVFVAPKDHGDVEISSLQSWLEAHHTRPVAMTQLARRAAMSQRTLNRRFLSATGMAPVDYLHRLRIESAKRMLDASRLSVEQITGKVGYENARSFSRLFKARVGLTPREYRDRFSGR